MTQPGSRRANQISVRFSSGARMLVSERVELLRSHLPRRVHVHYAMKANPMPAVVAHLAGLVDGLDIASAG